mgnify:CR=1 FL=1
MGVHLSVPSSEPDTQVRASGLTATPVTLLLCPASVALHVPLSRSQTLADGQQQQEKKHSKKKQGKKGKGEGESQGSPQGHHDKQEQGPSSALATLANADSVVRLWVQVLRPEHAVRVIDGKLRVNKEIR